ASGPPVLGFVFTNNLARHNSYGIIGTDHGFGNDSISAYLPASEITRNVIAGGTASRYPAGNSFPSTAQFAGQFVSYEGGDYRLTGASPWRRAATDGFDLGALLDGASGGSDAIGEWDARGGVRAAGTKLPSGVVASPYFR